MDSKLVSDAEAQLKRIPDVSSVAIEHSDRGIDAIHVVARDARRPKHIVRDVVSSLRAALNLPVDHKKVSVVTEVTPGGGRPREGSRPRPSERVTVVSIMIRDRGVETEAEVVLGIGGREVIGTARGSGAAIRPGSLTAEATLRALERLVTPSTRFALADVKESELAGCAVLSVAVSVSSGRDTSLAAGGAWIEGDPHRAAVHATLDALNRLLGRFERARPTEFDVTTATPSTLDEVRRVNGR